MHVAKAISSIFYTTYTVGHMRMSHRKFHQYQGGNVSVITSMGSFLFSASQFVSYLLLLFGTLDVLS